MQSQILNPSLKALIHLLNDGRWHGGDALGLQLGLSRAGIWKAIHQLQSKGVRITSLKGKGYQLKNAPIIFLDEPKIIEAIPTALRNKFYIEIYDTVASTNDTVALFKTLPHPLIPVCFAEAQTNGRGRQGRAWHSPFGENLYCSSIWQFPKPMTALGGYSMVISLAIIEALASTLGLTDLTLKWPNDIMYQGKKLGGILVELKGEAHGDTVATVGIGLNVNMPEATIHTTLDQPWTSLAMIHRKTHDRNLIAGRCLASLKTTTDLFIEAGIGVFQGKLKQYGIRDFQQIPTAP